MTKRKPHPRSRRRPAPISLAVVSETLLNADPIDWPLHAVRLFPAASTTGWVFWTGEPSDDPAKFAPCHVEHLVEKCPELAEHLDRPPGTRLVVAPGYQGIWFDETLLLDDDDDEYDDEVEFGFDFDELDSFDVWAADDDDDDEDEDDEDHEDDEIVPAASP